MAASLTLDVSGYTRGIGAAEADTRRLINMLRGIGNVSAFDETTADVRQLDRALDDVPASARRAGSAADNAFDAFSGELEQLDDRTRHVARSQDQIGDAAVLASRRAKGALSTVGAEASETAADARKAALSQEQIGTAAISAGRLAERAATEAAQSLNLITAAAERAAVAERGIGAAATMSAAEVAAASRLGAGGGPMIVPGGGGPKPDPTLLQRGVGMAHTVRSIGFTIAGFEGIMRLASGIRTAVVGASDLNESLNKTKFTFGDSAGVVIDLADEMRRKFGQSRSTILDTAAGFGLIGKAANLSNPEAAKMSTRLARLAVDAQSFFNVPLPEALAAFKSGLVGEAEPMRRFGVLLDENTVKQHAYAMGIARVGAELTQAQKVQSRADLILNAPAMQAAAGDMERTADQFANRMRIVFGRIREGAVDLGTAAIPGILRLVDVLEEAGRDAGPVVVATFDHIGDAVDRLEPFFRNTVEIGSDVWHMLVDLAKAGAPVVGLLLAIGGTGIIEFLNGLSGGVREVTEFLAENEDIVRLLAIAYGVSLVPKITAAATAMKTWVATEALTKAMAMTNAVTGMASSFATIAPAAQGASAAVAAGAGTSALSLRAVSTSAAVSTIGLTEMGVAGVAAGGQIAGGANTAALSLGRLRIGWLGVGLGIGGAVLAAKHFLDQWGQEGARRVTQKFDPLPAAADIGAWRRRFADLLRERDRIRRELNQPVQQVTGRQRLRVEFEAAQQQRIPTASQVPSRIAEQRRLRGELGETEAQLRQASERVAELYAANAKRQASLQSVALKAGVTEAEAARIAAKAGIDLEQGSGEATAAVIKLKGEVDVLAGRAGVSGDALALMFGDSYEAAKSFLETVTEISGKIGDAFRADMDVTTHIEADPTKITDTLNQIAELRKQGKEIPAELAKIAQSPLAQLKEFYAKAIPEGQAFGANYMKAIAAGFDPALLERVMLQGPEKAGPLLTALVSQQGLQMVDLVNKSEAEIRRQGAFIEELATKQMIHQVVVQQLTTKAVDENATKRTTSLVNAIKVQDVVLTLGTGATYNEVARLTGLKTREIQKIVDEWGLKLFGGIDITIRKFGGEGAPPGFKNQQAAEGALWFNGRSWNRTGDVKNAHQPEMVRAGAYRGFAEDETGGELYAPLANDHRRPRAVSLVERVVKMFGYEMVPKSARRPEDRGRPDSPRKEHRASEGAGARTPGRPRLFAAGDLLPAVPKAELAPYNITPAGAGKRGLTTTEIMRAEAVRGVNKREQNASRWLAGAAATSQARGAAQMGAGGPGSWRAITEYLSQFFIPYTVTSTTGGRHVANSYHYSGKAVDLVGNMPVIFRGLLGMQAKLAELFYDRSPFYIKNARRVPGAIGGHLDHVHAAVFAKGGIAEYRQHFPREKTLDPRTGKELTGDARKRAAARAGRPIGRADSPYEVYARALHETRLVQWQRFAKMLGSPVLKTLDFNAVARWVSGVRAGQPSPYEVYALKLAATRNAQADRARYIAGAATTTQARADRARYITAGAATAQARASQKGYTERGGVGTYRPSDIFYAWELRNAMDRAQRARYVSPGFRNMAKGGIVRSVERDRLGVDPARDVAPQVRGRDKDHPLGAVRPDDLNKVTGMDLRRRDVAKELHEGTLRLAPFQIPSFATGGTVPGPVGKPQVILAHGGEQVQRVGAPAGSRTHNVNVKTEITIHATGEVRLTRELQRDLDSWANDRDRHLIRMVKQDG